MAKLQNLPGAVPKYNELKSVEYFKIMTLIKVAKSYKFMSPSFILKTEFVKGFSEWKGWLIYISIVDRLSSLLRKQKLILMRILSRKSICIQQVVLYDKWK